MLTVSHPCNSVSTKFELVKLLKVVGENTAQTIVPIVAVLPVGTGSLVDVSIITADESFHLFTDKVVKQGTLVVTATVTTAAGTLATFATTAPFIATTDISGVTPGLEADVQFHNILIENDLVIAGGVLTGKVHLIEEIKVSVFVQRYVATSQSPSVVYPPVAICC